MSNVTASVELTIELPVTPPSSPTREVPRVPPHVRRSRGNRRQPMLTDAPPPINFDQD